MERTLVLLKPDAVERGLMGRIISRFEDKGLKIAGLELRIYPAERLEEHYAVHRERPFYRDLVDFMSSGPVCALVVEGKNAIETVRLMVGKTNSAESPPGTIRGDLGMSFSHNLVHASDGPDTAASELALWFGDAERLCDWTPVLENVVYNAEEELS